MGSVGTKIKYTTPKDIPTNKFFIVEKLGVSSSGDYGRLAGSDVRGILKGFHNNGLFWEKKGTSTIYTIREVK